MRRAVITGEKQVDLVDAPEPTAFGDWVKIKVNAAPMCTEYKDFQRGIEQEYLGHEAGGRVVSAGPTARFQNGDRVVATPLYPCGECRLCRSGELLYCEQKLDLESVHGSREGEATFAEYHLKPDWLLHEIPEDLSFRQGSMACCGLGPSFGALNRMGVDAFDSVLISGLGPVGLGGIINANYRGATVIGVEPSRYRADLANTLGADVVIDPSNDTAMDEIMAATNGEGVDAAIDCSGVAEAQRFMLDAVRTRGQATFIADSGEVELDPGSDLVYPGRSLHGQWHYSDPDVPDVFEIIRNETGKIERFITHTYPLEEVQAALETQVGQECGKVVLEPWPEGG